jgi:diacylglycerol kinase (ATP)
MHPFRRAALIYNPVSGRKHQQRLADIHAAVEALRHQDIDCEAIPTRAPGTAGEQAHAAIASGAEVVFACGGDGTIHEVLQGMINQPAALGIIPLGTGNVLGFDLRIPRNPAAAAHAAIKGERRRIAVGQIKYRNRAGNIAERYFLGMAGIGADALLVYRLSAELKTRYGLASFFLLGGWMLLRHRFERFRIELEKLSHERQHIEVAQVMAMRVRSLGPYMRDLAPSASLQGSELTLLISTTTNRLRIAKYVFSAALRRPRHVAGIELVQAQRISCYPGEDQRIYVQADGELLGYAPAEISVVPEAFTLLCPHLPQPSVRM